MRYLTKQWYELCQQTFLDFGREVHNGVGVYNEALYVRFYKRKEKAYVKMKREVYDVDPRFMLECNGATLVPLDKFVNSEEIKEEDQMIYHMPPEEKENIQKLIEEYDNRPPFDEKKCREEFLLLQEMSEIEYTNKLPGNLLQKIADIRVFTLGYCTKEVLNELKELSKENKRKVDHIMSEYSKDKENENIPQIIKERFGFHDCIITEFISGKDIVIYFDSRGGFTPFNMITFVSAQTTKQDESLVGSTWIYDELYCIENGYEVHILFDSNEGTKECIIKCNDIIIEEICKTA